MDMEIEIEIETNTENNNFNVSTQDSLKSLRSSPSPSHSHSPIQNIETNSKECWSPRFEFDAPRYTNFSAKKYQETRKLLNKIVLNQDENENEEEEEEIKSENFNKFDNDNDNENENNNDKDKYKYEEHNKSRIELSDDDLKELEIEISFLNQDQDQNQNKDSSTRIQNNFNFDFSNFNSSEIDIDEWFSRFHPLQEPLRPMTPPGPLISPERERDRFNGHFQSFYRSERSSHSNTSKTSSVKSQQKASFCNTLNSPSCDRNLNTPSKGPNTRIGLRAKPARVLKSSCSGHVTSSNLNSSPSISPIRSNYFNSNRLSNNNSSPSKSTSKLNFIPSSPIRTRSSDASSMTLSISSLTKNGNDYQNNLESKPSTFSPIKQLNYFNAKNNSLPSSPLRKTLRIQEVSELILPVAASKKQDIEIFKRSRLENYNDSIIKINNNNLINNKTSLKRPKNNQADLEDIKQLLNQHNNRLKPPKHFNK